MDTPRRRAASAALSISPAISTSRTLTESKFTAEKDNLVLNLGQNRQVVRPGESVSSIFQRRKQVESLLKPV